MDDEVTTIAPKLSAPFAWFGGKSRAASLVWNYLGDPPNYIEPFAGSLAVLLRRPMSQRSTMMETVNDLDGSITNFWRAIKHDSESVAEWASNPVHELDLHARHLWLHRRLTSEDGLDAAALAYARDKCVLPFAARLTMDQEWFDSQFAGLWAWVVSSWIGNNCARPKCNSMPRLGGAGKGVNRQLPRLGDAGIGVNRKLPRLGDAGIGVNRKLPHLGGAGKGECARRRRVLVDWFSALSDRLRNVDVCCGDWTRVLSDAVLGRATPCAVFLDPPYSQDHGIDTVYGEHHSRTVAADVLAWCKAHGQDRNLRIALCGYDTEHVSLDAEGWTCEHWKAAGGYANQSKGENTNRHRERIWFSPHCKRASLFDAE